MHRNNLRIRGVRATSSDTELPSHIQTLFHTLADIPDNTEIVLDRTHQVYSEFKRRRKLTADTLTRVHFFQQKEQIYIAAGKMEKITFEGDTITIFQDISGYTLTRRK